MSLAPPLQQYFDSLMPDMADSKQGCVLDILLKPTYILSSGPDHFDTLNTGFQIFPFISSLFITYFYFYQL